MYPNINHWSFFLFYLALNFWMQSGCFPWKKIDECLVDCFPSNYSLKHHGPLICLFPGYINF